jgi:glutamate/aspartate transport system substrate-binding protein
MHLKATCFLAVCFLAICAVQAARADTLETIRSRGSLIIGFRQDAPPFSSLGPDKQPRGYSIDLCKRIAEGVKSSLGLKQLQIRYVPVTAKNRIDKLTAGDIDIECGSTTRTISRQQRVDFTLFTFVTGTELLVPSSSSIHGPADLDGKKIAIQPGTTTERVMRQLLSLRLIKAEIVPVQGAADGLAAVENGTVDAYASDALVLDGLMATAKNPHSLRLSGSFYSYEPYALMVRQNEAAFRLVADRTLAYLYQSGAIADLYRRWFGKNGEDHPPPLLSSLFAIQSLAP